MQRGRWLKTIQNHKRGPDDVQRTARRYKQEYERADEVAMENSLMIFTNSSAQSAAIARMFSSLGHSRTQGRITALRVLYFAEGQHLSQNQIRAEMNVTSANVTYLIDELEKEGLVARGPHPTDRRATSVELTNEGRSVCDLLVPAMARFMEEMSRGFTKEEKLLFNQFLRRFYENTSASYQNEGGSDGSRTY